jgi:hypothetical protein
MQKLLKTAILAVLMLFAVLSCRKEKPFWDADLVAPIASSSLSLSNLFPDTILQTNSDSSISIAFNTDLFNFAVDSVLQLPDTSIVNRTALWPFPFGYATYSPGSVFPLSNNQATGDETDFDVPNGVLLKNAIVRSGKIKVGATSSLRQPTIFKCTVPSATLNGSPLVFKLPLPAGTQSNPSYHDTIIDVSNYNINLTGILGNKSNTLIQKLELQIPLTSAADTIKYKDSIISTITFIDLVPQFGLGYFGSQNISVGPDTTVFDIFNKIKAGNLNLNNATFKLNVINEFGIDMKAKISSVKSINSINNSSVTLTGSPITNSFNLNRASRSGNPAINPVITPTTKTLTLNGQNSNIVQFINNLPDKISYALTAQLNPLGNISGANDFAFYGTSLKATMDIDIPLNFSASNITLKDTVLVDFSAIPQSTDNINYGNLLLSAGNSYPFSLNVQGYLLDENNSVIDSLFSSMYNTVDAGLLDVNNKVIASKTSVLRIPLNPEKFTTLKRAKKIYFVSKFNTANQPTTIKFYDYYKLDLRLTADVNYSINK